MREDSPLIKKILAIRDSLVHSEGLVKAAMQRLSSWASKGKFNISRAYNFSDRRGLRFRGLPIYGVMLLHISMLLLLG